MSLSPGNPCRGLPLGDNRKDCEYFSGQLASIAAICCSQITVYSPEPMIAWVRWSLLHYCTNNEGLGLPADQVGAFPLGDLSVHSVNSPPH
jgi:hypothetical protein